MKLYKDKCPTVSIIVPTYNRKQLLKRAINSVFNQTCKNWELIIVDDGSNDSTVEYINSLVMKFENIKLIKHKNRGLPLSLNSGILLSAGKYITFLGSDDEYNSNHLQLRINYLQNNTGIDLLYGGIKIIGNPYVKDKNDLSKIIHLSECIIGGTFFGKRDIFIKLNGFTDIKYSEDSEFIERAKILFNIKKVDFPTYIYYRDTENSICNTI